MLTDVGKDFPAYQRRLIASGFVSRFRLARGVTNLTGAGLDLADRLIGTLLEGARRRWPLEVVAHPPICRDQETWRFARDMSPAFDGYRLGEGEYLWFDTNLAHLDWLRERLRTAPPPVAVASDDGVYRPVLDVQSLIRDEFIAPSAGVHIATPAEAVAETWQGIMDVVAEVAHAAGVPALLVEREPPAHYARRAVGALLPHPSGGLAPWMLAYELGSAFDDRLGVQGIKILEIGMTSRVLAFAAHLQEGRAAVFPSRLSPLQLAIDLRGSAACPPEAVGLRHQLIRAGSLTGRPPTGTGLAPVVYHPGHGTYRALLDDYRVEREIPGSLTELLAAEDTRLRQSQESLLGAHLGTTPAGEGSPPWGTVLRGIPCAPAGTRLDPRTLQ